MKFSSLRSLILLLTVLTISSSAFSQLNLPQKSPKASTSYTVGLTEVTINYSSPAVNERVIWGDLLPYDKVWRAGANAATTVEFSTDVTLEGKNLAAGKYSLFMIPRADNNWTMIFNTDTEQWGAYKYDESKDALRVDIKAKMKKSSEERLTYQIKDLSMESGYIRFGWEKVRLAIRFRVNYLDQAIKNVETAMQDTSLTDRQWVMYAQGADFLLGQEKKTELALEWATKSTTMFNHSWNWWVMAQAQAASGKYKEAVASIAKSKETAMANEKDSFYTDEQEMVEAKATEWKTKL